MYIYLMYLPFLCNRSQPITSMTFFVCPIEGCKFKSSYKGHIKRHLGEHAQSSDSRQFKCTFPGCNYSATREGYLRSHKFAKKHHVDDEEKADENM